MTDLEVSRSFRAWHWGLAERDLEKAVTDALNSRNTLPSGLFVYLLNSSPNLHWKFYVLEPEKTLEKC